MALELLITLTSIFVLLYAYTLRSKRQSLPGPFQLPILGNTVQLWLQTLRDPIEVVHANLAAKYGPIYKLRVGEVNQVVISDLDTIKSVLRSDEWYDRFHHDFNKWSRNISSVNLGLLLSNGKVHKETRKFTTRTGRTFGFEKNEVIGQLAVQEAEDMVHEIDEAIKKDAAIVSIDGFFTHSSFNVAWGLMSNQRFPRNDPKVKQLLKDLVEFVELQGIAFSVGLCMPTLLKVTPSGRYIRSFHRKIIEFVLKEIEASKSNERFTKDGSFLDTFLHEIEKRKKSEAVGPMSESNVYTEEQMAVTISDLILAGTHTSASTLQFAILAITLNPDVQERVQAEIDSIIGRRNVPMYSYLKRMPYLEATICEILRMSVVAAFIVRSTTQDTTINGHHIGKNTDAVMNIYSIHMDETVWEDPAQFRPQRFLNEKNEIVNTDKMIPFGLGTRVCIGEKIARVSIFVVLVTLLQNFKFEPIPTTADSWLKFRRGLTYIVEGYCVKATRRN